MADLYPTPIGVSENGTFPRRPDPVDQGILYEERLYGRAFGMRIPVEDMHKPLTDNPMFHGAELVWNRDLVDLMVIDGQHRLVALKAALKLLEEEELAYGYEGVELQPDQIDQLSLEHVAICVVFPPQLYAGNKQLMPGDTLVRLFRQVFVDVNKNARPVSESRNILLNERDLVAVFTRGIIERFPPAAMLPKNTVVKNVRFRSMRSSGIALTGRNGRSMTSVRSHRRVARIARETNSY